MFNSIGRKEAALHDQPLIDAATAAHSEVVHLPSLTAVLTSLAEGTGWSVADERVLLGAGEEAYYSVFEGLRGRSLRPTIAECLRFARVKSSEDGGAMIARVEGALRRIGATSPMNRLRIARFGISESSEAGPAETLAE